MVVQILLFDRTDLFGSAHCVGVGTKINTSPRQNSVLMYLYRSYYSTIPWWVQSRDRRGSLHSSLWRRRRRWRWAEPPARTTPSRRTRGWSRDQQQRRRHRRGWRPRTATRSRTQAPTTTSGTSSWFNKGWQIRFSKIQDSVIIIKEGRTNLWFMGQLYKSLCN